MGPEMPPTMPILTSCASAAPARAAAANSDVAATTAAFLPVAADSLSDDKVMENFLSTEGFAALGRPYTAAAAKRPVPRVVVNTLPSEQPDRRSVVRSLMIIASAPRA